MNEEEKLHKSVIAATTSRSFVEKIYETCTVEGDFDEVLMMNILINLMIYSIHCFRLCPDCTMKAMLQMVNEAEFDLSKELLHFDASEEEIPEEFYERLKHPH